MQTNNSNFYEIYFGKNETILPKIAEKINQKAKLIYLDPPYNTKRSRGARKNYNDTFSNWRDMMLKVSENAHRVLNDNGFLVASINQRELFTLKDLLDEVFNHNGNCFIGIFPVKIRHKERQLMINSKFHDLYEYLLIYSKNPKTNFNTEFKHADEINYTSKIEILDDNPILSDANGKKIEIYDEKQYRIIKEKPNKDNFRRYLICGKIATANWSGEFHEKYLKQYGEKKLIKVHGLENKGNGFRWFETTDGKRKSGVYFQSFNAGGRPKLPHNDIDLTEIAPMIYKEGGEGTDFKDSKKPEELMKIILSMTTNKNDLVLDLYGGSGTTIATAIKMKRNCITFESSEESLEVIKTRLENLKKGNDLEKEKFNFDYSIN